VGAIQTPEVGRVPQDISSRNKREGRHSLDSGKMELRNQAGETRTALLERRERETLVPFYYQGKGGIASDRRLQIPLYSEEEKEAPILSLRTEAFPVDKTREDTHSKESKGEGISHFQSGEGTMVGTPNMEEGWNHRYHRTGGKEK